MEVAKEFREGTFDTSPEDLLTDPIRETPPDGVTHPQASARSSSSYTLASDQSLISRDVDRWLRTPSPTPTETTGVQRSRVTVVQRSTLATDVQSLDDTGLWYILALLLPLFNVTSNSINTWRCSPSTILNTAELFLSHVGRACSRVRCHIRRLAQNQMSRELFATAMDVVLVVYAVGFLILSMYQAAIIG